MMMSEFVERTGFQPTTDEYEQIEDAYYNFDGDKDAFCKAFVKQGGELKIYKARADEVAQELRRLEYNWGKDHPSYQKQKAIQAHYEAVARAIANVGGITT